MPMPRSISVATTATTIAVLTNSMVTAEAARRVVHDRPRLLASLPDLPLSERLNACSPGRTAAAGLPFGVSTSRAAG
jgi:hypothetical protein